MRTRPLTESELAYIAACETRSAKKVKTSRAKKSPLPPPMKWIPGYAWKGSDFGMFSRRPFKSTRYISPITYKGPL